MTVLVTGGAGYIGSHAVLELADRGEPVVVLDNLTTGFASSVPTTVPLVVRRRGRPGAGRLRHRRAPRRRHHPFRGQAHPAPIPSPSRWSYYLNNTVKSRALIETAVERGIKHFIFSSTAAIYGETDVPRRDGGDAAPTRCRPTAAPS